jgi:hypothetical protein
MKSLFDLMMTFAFLSVAFLQLEAPCEAGVIFVTADALIVLVAQGSLPSVSHLRVLSAASAMAASVAR